MINEKERDVAPEEVKEQPEELEAQETEPATPEDELQKLKDENARLMDNLKRSYAEFDNFRKRMNKEKERWIKYANEEVIKEVLLVVDSFEQAIKADHSHDNVKSMMEGFQLIYSKLMKTLENNEVQKVDALGEKFDPNFHEAISFITTNEEENNCIINVVQEGYKIKDKLIRPSKVVVAKNEDAD